MKIDNLSIDAMASEVREILGADVNGPIDLLSFVKNKKDITLVFYPFDEEISGMCIKKAKVIAINSNATQGKQRFSLAHELYHLYQDNNEDGEISYDKDKTNVEKIADKFASYLLMPHRSFIKKYKEIKEDSKDKFGMQEIIRLEQFFQVSHHAILMRLSDDKLITEIQLETYRNNVTREAKKMGYSDELYKKRLDSSKHVLGAYISKLNLLKDKGLISESKYQEYLEDIFLNLDDLEHES